MPVCNGQVDFIVALVFNFYYCIMTDAERRRPVEHYCCEDKEKKPVQCSEDANDLMVDGKTQHQARQSTGMSKSLNKLKNLLQQHRHKYI